MSGYYVEMKYGPDVPWHTEAGPFPSWEAAYAYLRQVQQYSQEEATAIASTSLSGLFGQAAVRHFLTGNAQYRVVPVEAAIPVAATTAG
jgi:hypothetical protein